jgi:hypothetical protein
MTEEESCQPRGHKGKDEDRNAKHGDERMGDSCAEVSRRDGGDGVCIADRVSIKGTRVLTWADY